MHNEKLLIELVYQILQRSNQEGELGGTSKMRGGDKKCIHFIGKPEGKKNNLKNLRVDGKITLKWIFNGM
jgi:hypothetical protein